MAAGLGPIEIDRPFVDFQGYDLVATCGRVVRHIQLTWHSRGSAGDPSTLATKPSACVVNIVSRVTPDGTRIEFDRAARASVPANPAGPELRLTQSSIPYPQAMPESRVTTPLLTPRFRRAFALASEAHATQVRKGTKIPYLAHLMSVAALVLESGGDEDCAIGGLLHDAVEDSHDGEAMLTRIRSEFGDRVSAIVEGCSDAVAVPGQRKPDWRKRKEAYLCHLEAEDNRDVLLVSACDKLHNARSIVADLRTVGDAVWSRFNAGKADQLWYYGSLAEAYEEKSLSDPNRKTGLGPVADELTGAVADMRTQAVS